MMIDKTSRSRSAMRLPTMIGICALLMASMPAQAASVAEPIRATTTSGPVIGRVENGIHVFRGIPYAQPPVGDLRWKPPQPIRWTEDRQADVFGAPCLQQSGPEGRPNAGGVVGSSSEDCLYLNVWAPAQVGQDAPIMLWLYGGGGVMGSGSVPAYEGEAFARDGVVLVTINYRHGSLAGFAHPALTREAGADGLVGNYHLMDALAAIDWIRANAASFGGDAENLTIFGESAGATMVANLVASPHARGRFAKAIIQSSGSLPTPAPTLQRAEEIGSGIATALGLPGAEATAEQLRALPAERLMPNRQSGFGLRTVLDGKIMNASIMDTFVAGQAADIPLIIGTNSDEGRLSGTQRVAALAMSGAPVWQYFFDYVPDWRRPEQPNGVPHAGEIPYVFDTLAHDRAGARMTPADHAVAARVHSCWVAFAKSTTGARSLTCVDGFEWPARSLENQEAVALFATTSVLGQASELRSPPNGAAPGPTSRDED